MDFMAEVMAAGQADDAERLREWLSAWMTETALPRALRTGSVDVLRHFAQGMERAIARGEADDDDFAAFIARCESCLQRQSQTVKLAETAVERSARARTVDEEEAWQDAFERIATRVADGRVHTAEPLDGLGATVAKRQYITALRRGRRIQLTDQADLELLVGTEGRTLDAEAEAEMDGAEIWRQLSRLVELGQVSRRDVAVVWRRYGLGDSPAEVAAALGLSGANVRQICCRTVRRLREDLDGRSFAAAV